MCGMKNAPMSWEQVNYANESLGETPRRFADCFFYVCNTGENAAKDALEQSKDSGLISFGSYDKPHTEEERLHGIKGRYVANGVEGLNDGDIVVTKHEKPVVLTSIRIPAENKRRTLLKSLSK